MKNGLNGKCKDVFILVDQNFDLGGHAWPERCVWLVDRDLSGVDLDVRAEEAGGVRQRGHGVHGSVDNFAWEGVDPDPGFKAFLHAVNLRFVNLGVHPHVVDVRQPEDRLTFTHLGTFFDLGLV